MDERALCSAGAHLRGIILSELRDYAEEKFGAGTWNAVLKRASLEESVYLHMQEYPDAQASALVTALSAVTRRSLSLILEDFGGFIVPALMKMHGHVILPQWKTIDVIEHTERAIHSAVRTKDPGADPPQLVTKRLGPDEVLLVYSSPRKMCALAVGISKGLGKHFNETIVVNHRMCMQQGAPRCEIIFRKFREGRAAKRAP